MFPDEFKIIVDAENFEFVQRLLFMSGMNWTFDGRSIKPYSTYLEFSFLHVGRLMPGVIQMYHHRSLFNELAVPELIIKWNPADK